MLMTEQAQMESESKRCEYLCPQGQPRSSSIPLLLLVKQILKVRLSQNGFMKSSVFQKRSNKFEGFLPYVQGRNPSFFGSFFGN